MKMHPELPDPSDAPPVPAWRAVGCTVTIRAADPYPWCGRPLYGAMVVGTYPLPLELGPDERPDPRGLLLCHEHFDALTRPVA